MYNPGPISLKELGEIRRSQVITTFGPGAIVDLLPPSNPKRSQLSVVMSGIDMWDKDASHSAMRGDHEQVIREPRLERVLNVSHFRLPPVVPKNRSRDGQERHETSDRLVGIQFPKWLMCPTCRRIKHADEWDQLRPQSPVLMCPKCDKPVTATRFVRICTNGCLDDFPWTAWAHWGSNNICSKPRLYLEAHGAGLGGLIVKCKECNRSKSMEDCFTRKVLAELGLHCQGKRPWLNNQRYRCDGQSHVAYRGSSNVYFPVTRSAVSIPPWSDRLQAAFSAQKWQELITVNADDLVTLIKIGWKMFHLDRLNYGSPSDVAREIQRRKVMLESVDETTFRPDEFNAFMNVDNNEGGDFEVRSHGVPTSSNGVLGKTIEVRRLREVKVLTGFTRVKPLSEGGRLAPMSQQAGRDWLPAVEVRGEGIFIQLDVDAVKVWESRQEWIQRTASLPGMPSQITGHYNDDNEQVLNPATPRFLLLHSFAHAMLRGLVLESGYSTASLAERLYVGEPGTNMAGVLIYTAAGDSDGTLGGLCRQASPDRFEPVFLASIRAMEWCSNDPLCSDDRMSESEPRNLGACHSCLFAPETACEHFNHYLDRQTLVGTPADRSLGFFSDLLTGKIE